MATSRRAELGMALVPIALAVITLGILLTSRTPTVIVNQQLALAIDMVATLVAAAVAVLGWIRYREAGEQAALWRGSALLVLGTMNAFTASATVLGVEGGFGLSLNAPGQLPLWMMVLTRALAAALLVTAGLAAIRDRRVPHLPPLLVLWVPALVTIGLGVVAAAYQDALPALISAAGLASLSADPGAALPVDAATRLALLEIAIALGYLAAAALSYRAYRAYGRGTDAVLAVGLMLASFSQVFFAIHPAAFSSLVSSSDVLRVAFYFTLLATLAVEVRGDIRALHSANAELTRLGDAEVARATAEERARLAREIHDGMSQELWYAKLKQGRLLALPEVAGVARELAEEVGGAIESALAEARQAILALRPAEGGSFSGVVERSVADFSDRFGIPVECKSDPAVDVLPARTQAELLRIMQEALANVRKHADATLVRVELSASHDELRLTVSDNGRGFEADALGRSGYGLSSMRQRAELIGGTISVESRPQDGTRVVVAVPMGAVAT
ncbi:MAG: sensor histidine kinase [Chloroflexota bacterium]